jgi:hypothetical protein
MSPSEIAVTSKPWEQFAMSDSCIVEKCKESWEEKTSANLVNKNNCSGFLKGVAEKLGISMPMSATADGLVDFMKNSSSWKKVTSGSEAAAQAGRGYFVVAGLKGSEHKPARGNGHVAIVVSGSLYRGIYPMCWGGSIGSAQSQGNKSIGEIWNKTDRDLVTYYMHSQVVCK